MGEKFWIQDFETGIDRLRVHFITERRQVKSIIVIQYEAYMMANGGQLYDLIRRMVSFIKTFYRRQGNNRKLLIHHLTKNSL